LPAHYNFTLKRFQFTVEKSGRGPPVFFASSSASSFESGLNVSEASHSQKRSSAWLGLTAAVMSFESTKQSAASPPRDSPRASTSTWAIFALRRPSTFSCASALSARIPTPRFFASSYTRAPNFPLMPADVVEREEDAIKCEALHHLNCRLLRMRGKADVTNKSFLTGKEERLHRPARLHYLIDLVERRHP